MGRMENLKDPGAGALTPKPVPLNQLSHWVDPVAPEQHCDAVYERFSNEPDLLTLPVVDRGRPTGLVNRQSFMVKLADRFGRALYEQKPVTRLMDHSPLIVSHTMKIEDLGRLIVEQRPSALLDGFIVTNGNQYQGVGTALTLLALTLGQAEERNRKLSEAYERAETANQSKTEFLANMSHELRTPLNAIIGFSDMMNTEMFGPLGHGRYRDYARDISDSGKHLLGIINDILDISKVEAGKLELSDDRVNVQSLMEATRRLMAHRAHQGGIRVHMSHPACECNIRADRRILKQILLNLLTNAVKFSPPGTQIYFGALLVGDEGIRFIVKDQGPGMTPDEVVRAMEPFVQLDSRLNRRYEGVGLGLPLVKRMTEAHDGSFHIESMPGVGTSAFVTLPRTRLLCVPAGSRTAPPEAIAESA